MFEVIAIMLVVSLVLLVAYSVHYMHSHNENFLDCVGDIKTQIRLLRDKVENLKNEPKA